MYTFLSQILALAEETTPKAPTGLQLTDIAWLAAVVVVAYIMLRTTWKRIAKSRKHNEMPVRQRVSQNIRSQTAISDQLHELMAALADLSRQINGQIDTRLAKLEILLKQADQKIAQLENSAGDKEDNPDQLSADNAQDSIKNIAEKFQHFQPNLTPDQQNNTNTNDTPPLPEPQLSEESQNILDMSKKGMSKLAIAKKLNRPIGEIELILALANKK